MALRKKAMVKRMREPKKKRKMKKSFTRIR
jgi:hypothetical protein